MGKIPKRQNRGINADCSISSSLHVNVAIAVHWHRMHGISVERLPINMFWKSSFFSANEAVLKVTAPALSVWKWNNNQKLIFLPIFFFGISIFLPQREMEILHGLGPLGISASMNGSTVRGEQHNTNASILRRKFIYRWVNAVYTGPPPIQRIEWLFLLSASLSSMSLGTQSVWIHCATCRILVCSTKLIVAQQLM